MSRPLYLLAVLALALASCKSQKTAPPVVKPPVMPELKVAKPAGDGAPEEGAPAAGASSEALVLGIRNKDGLSTVFVDEHGFTLVGQGVAVPGEAGWSKVGIRRDVDASGNNRYETLFVTTQGKNGPGAHSFDDMEGCESERGMTVLFVGANHVSVEESGSGYCPDNAHPYGFANLKTMNLRDLASESTGLQISDVLAPATGEQLIEQGEKEINGDDCLAGPSTNEWAFVRRQGAWIVRGRLNYEGEVCRGHSKDFTVPTPAPASVTGAVAFPTPWKTLKAAQPAAVDAVASPSGRVVVVVTAKGLSLEVDGRKVAEYDAPASSIVQTQWAVGAPQVEQWRKQAAALLK